MNEMIIYTLQQWKKLFDRAESDEEILRITSEFFDNQVPIIIRQLAKDDSNASETEKQEG